MLRYALLCAAYNLLLPTGYMINIRYYTTGYLIACSMLYLYSMGHVQALNQLHPESNRDQYKALTYSCYTLMTKTINFPLSLFADDSLIFQVVNNATDENRFQSNIDALQSCATK